MRFKIYKSEVELIETVGELRAAISHLDDATPIRFEDPDTGWLLRLSPDIVTDDNGEMVFRTQQYWMDNLEPVGQEVTL